MNVICIAAKNPRTSEVYRHITVGKYYRMIERVFGKQIRIINDCDDSLNYPAECFNIPKRTSKGIKFCQQCQKKFIGKSVLCKKCADQNFENLN